LISAASSSVFISSAFPRNWRTSSPISKRRWRSVLQSRPICLQTWRHWQRVAAPCWHEMTGLWVTGLCFGYLMLLGFVPDMDTWKMHRLPISAKLLSWWVFSTLWNLYAWRGARELTCISSKGKLISHIDPLSGLMMCRRDFPHSCPTNSRFLRHVMSWIERVHRAGLLLHRLCTAHFDTFCDYEKSAMIGITRVFLGNALSMTDFILIWKLQSESKSSTPVTIARKCQ
jgi:hypothetical protein